MVDFNLYHILQILKAIGPEVNLSYQSSLSKPPTSRQNFANTLQPHCAQYLTLRRSAFGNVLYFQGCQALEALIDYNKR